MHWTMSDLLALRADLYMELVDWAFPVEADED